MSILFKQVTHTYGTAGLDEHTALVDLNLEIEGNAFTGLVGHTGSGKSTLVQLAAGLLRPTAGDILIDGTSIVNSGDVGRKKRRDVGLVFQYPEHQLFEETVAKDIAFGPKNQGLSDAEQEERVREAMALVGLDYERWKDHSPFDLSGGQKRRVAIAGVLAMHPRYLILDEPTAGLDPLGRDRILESMDMLHREHGIGIILVSHSMDDVARFADHIVVMNEGHCVYDHAPKDVFSNYASLKTIGLGVPQVTELLHRLADRGVPVDADAITIEAAYDTILAALKAKGGTENAR